MHGQLCAARLMGRQAGGRRADQCLQLLLHALAGGGDGHTEGRSAAVEPGAKCVDVACWPQASGATSRALQGVGSWDERPDVVLL